AAAEIAHHNHDDASAAVWLGVADDYQRSIKGWTVTTTGPLAPRYFIRLSKTDDPNAAISYNVGNGGPTLDQRSVIAAGFLELVRLGEQDLATHDNKGAAALLLGMSQFASGVGLIPEQDWELADLPPSPFGTDPTVASIGFRNGGPAGSAAPLTWSAASFFRLAGDLEEGRNVVLPKATYQRY